jgi:hypothetical protein
MCRRPEGGRSLTLTHCLHQLSNSRMYGVLRYVFFNLMFTGKDTLKIKCFSTYEVLHIGIVCQRHLADIENNNILVSHSPLTSPLTLQTQ